jgi:tRNA G46 methylase TrmB
MNSTKAAQAKRLKGKSAPANPRSARHSTLSAGDGESEVQMAGERTKAHWLGVESEDKGISQSENGSDEADILNESD